MKDKFIYNGKELKLENRSIHQASEKGIAIVYQELTLVPQYDRGGKCFFRQRTHE